MTMFANWRLRLASFQLAVAVVVGALAPASFAAVAKSDRSGLLEFRGGIQAQTTVKPATCTAGPGNAIAITLANVGGWSSLYLTASAPRSGERGVAKVSLQGTGHRDNAYAIALWNWTKKAGVGGSAAVHITANGTAGTINVVLPLVTVDDSSSFPAVGVALNWTSGICAHT